jgi:hypothetical protein
MGSSSYFFLPLVGKNGKKQAKVEKNGDKKLNKE